MLRPTFGTALLTLLLGACAAIGPDVPVGEPGLRERLAGYYERHALENQASCTSPRMTPTRLTVVDETADELVLDVRYWYEPWSRQGGSRLEDGGSSGGGDSHCMGFATRRFALAKTPDGLLVHDMSGERRDRPDSYRGALDKG